MKFLKYLLFFFLALVVVFIIFGFQKTVEYGTEITVEKPLKEAWAVTQDASKYGEWLEGFKSMELISGEQGAVGSQYKVIVNPGDGKDFEMIETVVGIDEFEKVDLKFESDAMDFFQTIHFSGDESSSTIKTDSKVNAKGFLTRAMFAMMETLGGGFTKQETKNFTALKKLIEENTTDYYPAPTLEEAEEALEAAEETMDEAGDGN